jgi:GT2 family glycosyltransferase
VSSGRADVAVVIPSWNSTGLLPGCLDSLADQSKEIELFVVDNGSTDGSVELLRDREVPYLSLPRNIGFAAAVNLGVRETSAPLLLVLNADTVLEPRALPVLTAALDGDPGLGGVQPLLLQSPPTGSSGRSTTDALVYSAGQALTADGRAIESGAGRRQEPGLLRPREVFGVCGAACLLRRELFTDIGGYDESYFAFYEDVDLNVRARIAGWRFGYVPEALVWHVGNASWQAGWTRPAAANARFVARNRAATQLKFMPASALPRILAVEFGSLAKAALERRFGSTLRGKLEAIPWLPRLLRERRGLGQSGDPGLARVWLGRA